MLLGGKGRPGRAAERVLALAVASVLVFSVFSSLPVAFGVATPAAEAAPTPSPLRGYTLTGPASPSLPVIATLAIPLRNVGLLDSLVMQVSNPTSPDYRHFLTPQQVRSDFLPTTAFDSLLGYARESGLTVLLTALDSQIVVEGTVSQLQSAFGAKIDTYTNGTYSYYASSGSTNYGGALLYATNATFLYTKPALATLSSPDSNVTFTSGAFSAKQLQPVYNATSLYAQGFNGAGETIGLLDYYGSPTIASDLNMFDRVFGIPDSKLNIIPIGPYDPNLGAAVGWSGEISLDVEAAHAMAPGATIDLYIADGALPLSALVAQIVSDDNVTTLSQSFSTPEWYYSVTSLFGGPAFMTFNALIPDEEYALGSLEGITFLASSGDGGGSGFSSGPEGTVGYPSSSPFVTSVGGTQTYFSGQGFVQTAWSNPGFIPNFVNEGGGGGGVSILEPRPWYQLQQADPPSFPNGRMNPDLSLQAGVDPATEIVDSGSVTGTGGTSESSPLLAGLLTLVAQADKGPLGLINPFIYGVGDNPAQYTKGFNPVTFGYIIPWKSSFGYNLATGWGSPNIGELATLLNATASQPTLSMLGEVVNGTGGAQEEFTPGQPLTLQLEIWNGATPVSTGSFTAELQTLTGTYSQTPMSFNPATGNWTATIVMGRLSGITDVYVSGSSGGVSGSVMGGIFAGYVGSITNTNTFNLFPSNPWSWNSSDPLYVTVYTYLLDGRASTELSANLTLETYSILTNSYTNASAVAFYGLPGELDGELTTPVTAGPLTVTATGDLYLYAPTVYGIYLQSGYLYPDVAAEPGSVAPGQYLTVISFPIPPVNVYYETSYETGNTMAQDVSTGANVSATLVSSTGTALSTVALAYQVCTQALRVCSGGTSALYGQLLIPKGTAPGLYTVTLHASYSSYSPDGNMTGNFYSQVWVSPSMLDPSVEILPGPGLVGAQPSTGGLTSSYPSSLYQGEEAHIVATLNYANGTAVKYGEFTAVVYPSSLAGQYATLEHTQYEGGKLVSLVFDPHTGTWVGNVTLPGPSGPGALDGLGLTSFQYSGPYDVYVTGISADGTPTSSELATQQPFSVQPYTFASGVISSVPFGSQMAFSGATITASAALSGDLFVGTNTIQDSVVTITGSQVQGTLNLVGSTVTLVGVSGGDIVATDSNVTLRDSTVASLSLNNSTVRLYDSSYGTVTPALPSIATDLPQTPIGKNSEYNITVTGTGLGTGSLSVWLDGAQVNLQVTSTSSGLLARVKINASAMTDGVHTLVVTARQSDGLSATQSVTFSTNAFESGPIYDLVYVAAAVAAAGVILAVVALMRGRPPRQPPAIGP